MANTSEKWLEKAISDGHINFLEYNKFTVLAKIGNGGFGDVLKCEWKENELTVALKCLRINTSLDETIEDFIKELKLLNKIQSHQNVIAFHGVTKDNDGQYNMVLEYANEGTLQEYLKVNSNHLQWIDKSRIAKEISHGLLFLHNNNIIYRDLHSKNILIHQQKPKIADFGLSKQINETSMTSNSKVYGMPAYVEPQCFSNTGYKRDKKSDVYSFGVILWEISSGKPPFQSVDSMFIHIHILNGNRETPKEGTPSQYVELYKQCWDENPNNRPEIKSVFDDLKQQQLDEYLNQAKINNNEDPLIKNDKLYLNHDKNAYSNSSELTLFNSNELTGVTKQLADEDLNRSKINDTLIKTDEIYLNQDINSNSSEPSAINQSLPMQDDNILKDKRNQALKYFNKHGYIKALEYYQEILKNSLHNDEDQKHATRWDLSNKGLKSKNLKELIKVLDKNIILTYLDLKNNKLGSNGGKLLADALCKNNTLEYLNLRYNNLGSNGGKALANALCKNFTLTSLNLNNNNLGLDGGKALADALCKNTTLTSLILVNNNLESDGGKALANALYNNTTLTFLDLDENKLGSEGGIALANALCKNITLKELHLNSNDLGKEGGKALANALCENTTLKELHLNSNHLETEGGKALADALCKNAAMKELHLNSNNLGTEGGKALAVALVKNTTLKKLYLYGNGLGTEGGKALEDALCKNTTLTYLVLEHNDMVSIKSSNPNIKILQ